MNRIGFWVGISLACLVGLGSVTYAADSAPALAELITIRAQETQGLPESVLKIMKRHKVPDSELSVFAQDLHAETPLLAHLPDKPRNPASTMKLLTTWAALQILGPAKRWNTEVWYRGELQKGVLQGDLILKGNGDPFFVHEYLWQLVLDLRQKGLKEIRGNVYVDNSYFEPKPGNTGDFDNSPDRLYNARPSALMFNFQATRFILIPDAENERVQVETFPKVQNLQLDNQIKFRQGKCRNAYVSPRFSYLKNGQLRLKGKYSEACGRRFIMRLLSSPEQHVFNAFNELWGMLGGVITGEAGSAVVDKKSDKRFHVYTSGMLADQIRLINKWSNNVMTRQLLLNIGAVEFEPPGTEIKGAKAIKQLLNAQGLNADNIVIENGAGLSRDASISARVLGNLLTRAWRDPYMPEFVASMPLLGKDGTLHRRLKRHDLRGRAHLKTGTLRNVKALAGYMLNRQGKRFVVVILHNGKRAARAGNAVQNALLQWLFEQ